LETYDQKISHLKALYHLALADNTVTQAEAAYIRIVAERLGIDANELSKFDGSEPELELPSNEMNLYSIFHRLALIIMIDGNAHDREKEYCMNLGIKMGLHPNAVSEIIEHVSKHGSMRTLPQDVMAIFKKYMN
jgi:hypothetical protein